MRAKLLEPKHFRYIDAVRGTAFLAVLTLHSAICVGDFPASSILKMGWYGVQLFFLASAITLCNSMAARSNAERYPMLSFYIRRLFRIAPLFWLSMVFYWSLPSVMPDHWLEQWAPNGVRPSYFVLTALFCHGWHPYTFNSIVPGGWSIAVEMTFYLIFPLCFIHINSLRRSAAAVLIAIILTKCERHTAEYLHSHLFSGIDPGIYSFFSTFWFPSQIGVFAIGIFTYHFLKSQVARTLSENRFWANIVFLFALVALPGFIMGGGSSGISSLHEVALVLAAMIVAMSACQVPLVVNPVICYIGKVSYSCYLVHFAALGLTLKFLKIHPAPQQPFNQPGHSLPNFVSFLEIFGVCLLITVFAATITNHLVETPGIALGRRLLKRLNSGQSSGR